MSNKIRHYREKAGLSRPQLAEKVQTSLSQIVKLERGERRLTQDWMEKIGPALAVPASALLDDSSPFHPVIGQVFANGEVKLRDPDAPAMISRNWSAGPVQSCIEVADDGFGPMIPAGSMLYVSFIEVPPNRRADYTGSPCVVWVADGRILVGQLIHGSSPDSVGLLLPNSRILHNLEPEVICSINDITPARGQTGAYPIPAPE